LPKSTALPVVKISTKSITLLLPGANPPPLTARVGDEDAPPPPAETVASPKSTAFPNVAIVMKLMLLLYGLPPSLPPKNNPRVELDAAAPFFLFVI